MLDCWTSQDVNYATKLAHACAPYNLKWIEECLPPQQYEGYRELKLSARLDDGDSGEHHGTLQSFRTLSETGIDIMQPDVGWCGGLTTLVEIAAIAKARGQLGAARLVGMLTSCGDHLHQHAVQRVSDDQSGLRHAASAVRPDPARRAGA